MNSTVSHPRLQELLDYWQDKRGDRAMPRRLDIDPIDLRQMLPNIFLVDVEGGGQRFRYRLVGTELTAIMGRELKGAYIDEMPFLFRKFALPAYAEVISRRAPCYKEINAIEAFFTIRYKRLMLPLSENGTDISMILGGIYRV
jgi:hypothetical protein